jgi:hypothetical protein
MHAAVRKKHRGGREEEGSERGCHGGYWKWSEKGRCGAEVGIDKEAACELTAEIRASEQGTLAQADGQ